MDVDSAEGRKASFKDMLMGGSEKEKSVGESLEAADIELGEGDVISGSVDGIPSIKFSKRVCSLLEKSTERTVVLKLLGRKITLNALLSKNYGIWKPIGSIYLMDSFYG
ncbi:hypothetical protein PVK06_042802 [Gossypium arboreum]|uniref:Uncharacterized protein n=1 Tax=Gossypium arboreum TaxID=29729 RepID=A0ABR0MLZ5_GOSAR|nr:hypothetical protein PVK06_042802 [Gossypium arboreum]